ncbi:hypothetical protein [Geofilum rubicundum]|uniref:hypothetical protein n=1 Tax=Geofilum rubicundum TaxID=472113 RepID=UPI0021CDC382|nr:hypothetical protein [Geofilum rubicundum]
MREIRLMKGNEAIAEAAIRCGVDGYFGYPITPQSEVMETLMAEKPGKRRGWLFCRPKVKLPPSIWYMAVPVAAKR